MLEKNYLLTDTKPDMTPRMLVLTAGRYHMQKFLVAYNTGTFSTGNGATQSRVVFSFHLKIREKETASGETRPAPNQVTMIDY